MKKFYRTFACSVFAALFASAALAADGEPDPTKSEIWQKLKADLFQDRPISSDAASVIELSAPVRAEDAATVPISIKTQTPQTADKYIKKIYLVIDKNPSPIGAVFQLTPKSGRADVETRVRIEDYSHVRAIAEMNDGKLFMASRFVKASGGCSAPAGKDQAAAMARLGKMKFKLDKEIELNKPNLAQLMISHPNNSGLAMDQLTRLFVPPRFVRKIEISYAGEPVMTAEVDFTISENPNFRFYFVPREPGELTATVVDTHDLKFTNSIEIKPEAAVASGT
ncbi:MAG: quinoprotein dehydrogenase-associated SoxYZ-like carrier [Burkholderiales bacterium]|nr:quinoprotein dehydrogenase-associated SoxYZ-like carrier [Burkholderiales bacterium]MDQ3195011.1 quinoprotein dehydrogenase-associated SoxYZ-like carrier [Pseudomonadota bacterium]